jgi:hypothetical protein
MPAAAADSDTAIAAGRADGELLISSIDSVRIVVASRCPVG